MSTHSTNSFLTLLLQATSAKKSNIRAKCNENLGNRLITETKFSISIKSHHKPLGEENLPEPTQPQFILK